MCTWFIEKTPVSGSGKGPDGWFRLAQANVYYDHPFHTPAEHTLNIDFVDRSEGVGARVAVELTPDSARELSEKILSVLESRQDPIKDGD